MTDDTSASDTNPELLRLYAVRLAQWRAMTDAQKDDARARYQANITFAGMGAARAFVLAVAETMEASR